jgi:hypothetical protein
VKQNDVDSLSERSTWNNEPRKDASLKNYSRASAVFHVEQPVRLHFFEARHRHSNRHLLCSKLIFGPSNQPINRSKTAFPQLALTGSSNRGEKAAFQQQFLRNHSVSRETTCVSSSPLLVSLGLGEFASWPASLL